MGDPKRPKKKYSGPAMIWEKERIDEEKGILYEYGIKNKKELWKVGSQLKKFKNLAKNSIADVSTQGVKEKQQFMDRLVRLGLISPNASTDDVLELSLKNLLERRLQTIVCRKGLARSIKQARQFITHRHIIVGDKKITIPSYLVTKEEESKIAFVTSSSFSDPEHPERVQKSDEKAPAPKKEAENK